MDKGSQAFRSGAALALPPEELDDAPQEQVDIDNEQTQANAKYASLKGHPGWELIKQDFEKAIANYRSGATLAAAALDPNINDAELGKLTRTSLFIADELERRLLTVEGAAMALEEDKKDKKNGRTK